MQIVGPLYLIQVVEERGWQHLRSRSKDRGVSDLCLRQVRNGDTHINTCERLLLRSKRDRILREKTFLSIDLIHDSGVEHSLLAHIGECGFYACNSVSNISTGAR